MQDISFLIKRITKENYHMFDDMVFWRMNGVERTEEEKQKNKNSDFSAKFSELEHQDFNVFAALCDNRFVGWIAFIYNPKIGYLEKGVIYIDELWTSPEYRRKGVALELMGKAFEYRKETGAVEIRLYTADDNIAAQELYKKCGLKITAKAVYMQS